MKAVGGLVPCFAVNSKSRIHDSGVLPPPANLGYYRDVAVLGFRASEGKDAAVRRAVPLASIVDLTSRLEPGDRLEWDAPAADRDFDLSSSDSPAAG